VRSLLQKRLDQDGSRFRAGTGLQLIQVQQSSLNKRKPNKMKAIRMRIQKFSRPLVILIATVIAIITSIVVANATQAITTPNAAFISYSLAQGANSAPITPATSRSVLIMGCCTHTLDFGVGQVTLLHHPTNAGMQWVGLESYGSAAITQGATSLAGIHIVYIDFNHVVDIRTASADTIVVHNGQSLTVTGNVTLIW
jgi:hypothetical protein